QVTNIAMPAGANTPDPMYIVYSPANGLVYVGDRGNNRVVAFDGITFNPVGSIPAGAGVFHQWGNVPQNQLWVVNDVDRTLSVLNMVTMPPITTIPIPANLTGTPHDIIVDSVAHQAYVTVNGSGPGQGTVVRFSTDTFLETGRVTSGDALHVFL